jgi:ribosomal protein S18 acetylase RimI-like enzyme
MQPNDVEAVVDLQVEFLDGSLLTDLGARFLRTFYRAALSHPDTRAFVAIAEGATVGAAIASVDVGRFNAHVKPRIVVPLAIALAPPRRWRIVAPLVQSLGERGPEPAVPAELLTLVVDGRFRQRGIGRGLLDALERSLANEAIGRYRVAVRSHLGVARAFYEATGFRFEQELTVLGRPMTYLTKQVPAPPRPQ